MGDLPIAARVVLAAMGQLTWWYLFRCFADIRDGLVVRHHAGVGPGSGPGSGSDPGSGSGSTIAPWVIFSVTFYAHGLLLGHAWHECQAQPTGYSLAQVLVSAAVAALAAALTWGVIGRIMNGRRHSGTVRAGRHSAMPAVLGALVVAVVLLWPAVAMWNGLADCTGTSESTGAVLHWWPSWLPV